MLLYGMLGVCAVFGGLLVCRYDMYDREPVLLLLLTAAIGFVAMLLVGPVETFTMERLGAVGRPIVVFSAIAATHEEIARLLVVVLIAVIARSRFDDPMDGIIYGSVTGLGMAVAESIDHLRAEGVVDGLLPGTEVVRLFGHLVLGGIAGFGVGMARLRMRRWVRVTLLCVGFAIALHFLWDWVALSARLEGAMRAWQTAAAVAIMLTGMMIYGILVVIGSEWSRKVFAPQDPRRLWGWPLTLLLPPRE